MKVHVGELDGPCAASLHLAPLTLPSPGGRIGRVASHPEALGRFGSCLLDERP
jgi:hypothetical protein